MLTLLSGLVAVSLGAHASARLRRRVRPNTPQAKRIERLKAVNPKQNSRMVNTMSAISNGQLDNTCGCR